MSRVACIKSTEYTKYAEIQRDILLKKHGNKLSIFLGGALWVIQHNPFEQAVKVSNHLDRWVISQIIPPLAPLTLSIVFVEGDSKRLISALRID